MSEVRRGMVFVVALTATCVTSTLAGLLAAALQGWFGVYDLWALFVWSMPLGCLTGAIAAGVSAVASRCRLFTRYLVGLAVGAGLGFLWTLGVAMLWGPWWGAMSLPALACWVAGGVSGMASGLVLSTATPMRLKIANAAFLGAFSVALVLANQPFFTWLSGDQTLTVVFLKLEPRDEPLSIESEHPEPPSNDVLSLLRLANVRGHVTLKWAGSVHGRGPGAKALILLRGPLTHRVTLPQPDRATILYVQAADGFKTYPAGAGTLNRGIELSGGVAGVWYSVELAGGGRQSGPAFSW